MVRFKNRYLLYEVVWKDNKADDSLSKPTAFKLYIGSCLPPNCSVFARFVDEAALLAVFKESLAVNFGDHGVSRSAMSLSVKYYNPVTNLCMLRCSTEEYRQVWCALSMITEIGNRRAMVHFLHLGGTLKTCQQAAIDHNQRLLEGLRLTHQQSKALLQAEEKLSNLEL